MASLPPTATHWGGCTLRRVRLGLKETAQRQKSVQSRHTNSLRRRCGKPTSHCNTLGRLYLAEGATGAERDGTEAEQLCARTAYAAAAASLPPTATHWERLYLAEGAAGAERDGTEAEERPESTELVVGRRVVGGHSHQLAVELVAQLGSLQAVADQGASERAAAALRASAASATPRAHVAVNVLRTRTQQRGRI